MCERLMTSSDPSRLTRVAVSGASHSSSFIALDVWERARSSNTCPSKTKVVITAADSKYADTKPVCVERIDVGNNSGKNKAAMLSKYAAPVPIAISVTMFGLTFLIDDQA